MDRTNPIRAYRQAYGLKMQELAERLGVTRSLLWKWENRGVSLKAAPKVSEVTGIPLHRLRPDVYPEPEAAS